MVLEKIVSCFFDSKEDIASDSLSVQSLRVEELKVGQVLVSNIVTRKGKLLLSTGQRLTNIHLQRLRNYSKLEGVREPVRVQIEIQEKTDLECQDK